MANEKSCGAIIFTNENKVRKYVIQCGVGIYQGIERIRLDGVDILAATVNESMANGAFTIGGSFEDETIPILYAALINNGPIDSVITTGDLTEFAAPLSENAYNYVWIGFAALILIVTIVAFILYRAGALAYLFTNLFYFFFVGICFQVFGNTFSINTLIGFLIGYIILAIISFNFYGKIKNEAQSGKTGNTALERGMKKATP